MLGTKAISNDGYSEFVDSVCSNAGEKPVLNFGVNAENEFTDNFIKDGIANKIVSAKAEDALASGFEIVGDTDGKAQKALNEKRLGFRKALSKAAKWTRLYGGAIILMIIADNRKIEEQAGKGEIVKFEIFSSARIIVNEQDLCMDPNSSNFGNPEYFTIVCDNGAHVRVHYTRCIVFNGEDVPDGDTRFNYKEKFFGVSCLYLVRERLKNMGNTEEEIDIMMEDLNVKFFNFKGLNDALSSKDGITKASDKVSLIGRCKRRIRAIIGDVGESMTNVKTDLGGVPEVHYRQMQMVAGASDYPVARLFGETGSGLSATGEGNQKLYDNSVHSWRTNHIQDGIEEIVRNFCERNLKINLSEIEWNPVSVPSQKEYVELCKIQADTFHELIQDGVLSPEEVREMAYVNGHTFQIALKE